ncbi:MULTISPECIES: sporulation-delaying protein SdpB family protein [Bacillus]|uniref:sporulation-delaying protein SdpB family protein n=1 Tax=Bacillus TaxID=1386 RepID=UPI0001F5BC00|nr:MULTISPECIES: sporulation-delaying protein SdpB family protein [Bacillus]ADV94851.1 hypothetical protein BSn5_11175 [Bacillus subtilis BSn5]ASC82990.1 hypothetical protein CDA59_11075 [Bacillus subtilis]KAA0932734.1 hypothetical protein FQ086_19030 [Bacillus sp. ANT_WA51]MBT2169785.1 HTTM domain-containing protein [Bacillus subtilis]MCZ8479244.1 HTTM domain-containing protein [Bacillus subtilis]
MFETLNIKIYKWANDNVPWTNVYGLARSIMALSTALTLALNDSSIFFRPGAGQETPYCNGTYSIFCTVPNNHIYLNLIRWICVILLLVVVSGWRPRLTGIIHWWISYSLQVSAMTIDGGEQVSAVFTLLLLPITLTDSRKWHWENIKTGTDLNNKKDLYFRVIALTTFVFIRIQIAILYFNSATAKLADQDWLNGTAVYYYAQDPMLGFPPLLHTLFNDFLSSPLVVIPTWGTLIIQLLLFAFLFSPKSYRKYMFIIAILMHEIFAVMFGLISFSMIMLGILILYLRPLEKQFHFSLGKRFYISHLFMKRGDAGKSL